MKPMRHKRQLLNNSDITTVLHVGTSGVLAVLGEDDYPYAVPLSYVYDEDCNRFDTMIRSVIAFGKICVIEAEKRNIMP